MVLLLTAVVPATTVMDGSGFPAFGGSSVFPRGQYGRCEMMSARISQQFKDGKRRRPFVFYIVHLSLALSRHVLDLAEAVRRWGQCSASMDTARAEARHSRLHPPSPSPSRDAAQAQIRHSSPVGYSGIWWIDGIRAARCIAQRVQVPFLVVGGSFKQTFCH